MVLQELVFISIAECIQLCYTSHNGVHVVIAVVGIVVNN